MMWVGWGNVDKRKQRGVSKLEAVQLSVGRFSEEEQVMRMRE